MCNGSGTPGKSTVPSGNNGSRTVICASVRGTDARGPYAGRAMLTTIDLRGRDAADARRLLPRAAQDVTAALSVVRPLCDDIRTRGADAVRDATARFDGVEIDDLRVPAAEIRAALDKLDTSVRAALEQAIDRTRTVHTAQLPDGVTEVEPAPGVRVAERWVPVNRVGLYVPGGNVAYP